MARHEPDKTSKWLIKHHGDALLFLGGAAPIRRWRAVQPEVIQPRKVPDGLLEVHFQGVSQAQHVLVEVGTYVEPRLLKQAWDDMLLMCLDHGSLPDVLVVVLRPKGRMQVADHRELASHLGWSALAARWKVVRLWEEPAERLLAAGDVGLVPWLPLTRFEGSPEALVRECRERIDRQAPPAEHANLLAVTQVLTKLRFPQPNLLQLLGGRQIMIESPLLKELLEEKEQEARQEDILNVLAGRFTTIPEGLAREVRAVVAPARLRELVRFSGKCKSLKEFQKRMKETQGESRS